MFPRLEIPGFDKLILSECGVYSIRKAIEYDNTTYCQLNARSRGSMGYHNQLKSLMILIERMK